MSSPTCRLRQTPFTCRPDPNTLVMRAVRGRMKGSFQSRGSSCARRAASRISVRSASIRASSALSGGGVNRSAARTCSFTGALRGATGMYAVFPTTAPSQRIARVATLVLSVASSGTAASALPSLKCSGSPATSPVSAPGAETTTLLQTSISITNPTYPDPYGGRTPASFASTAPPNIAIVDDKMVNPYSDMFNVGYSHQLGANMAINADGVYTKSKAFNASVNINTPVQSSAGVAATPTVRPYPA